MQTRQHNNLDTHYYTHYYCLDLEHEMYLCTVSKKHSLFLGLLFNLLGYMWYMYQERREDQGWWPGKHGHLKGQVQEEAMEKKWSSQKENQQIEGHIAREGWRKLQDLGEVQELYYMLWTVQII